MVKKEKFLVKWEKIRNKGLLAYVVKRGILCNGVILFITWSYIVGFVDNNYTFDFIHKDTFKIKLITSAIVSLLSGVFLSYVAWIENEKKYKKMKP